MRIASLLFAGVVMVMVLATLWVGTRFMIDVFAWMLRGFRPRGWSAARGRANGRVCPNRLCRYVNVMGARFCGQCGQALGRPHFSGGA